MMFYFAVSHRPVPRKIANRRRKILKSICPAGDYVQYYDPARKTWMAWAEIPNRGDPFNTRRMKEIMEAWQKAGV